ncbi:MAG: DUF1016 N-terminal domain-containing protein [Desulfobacula sp.]|nr:DUF1016 N-terminal domain-containing protein [Desulfobacula sp.]
MAIPLNADLLKGFTVPQVAEKHGWGAGVIPRLSKDIRNELPEVKGFSERNIGHMMRFAREYSMLLILQQPVAKIPWGHNILLMQKIKDLPTRLWYIRQAINISHPEKSIILMWTGTALLRVLNQADAMRMLLAMW